MKKFILAAVIFFLVLSTAIIKNTTKQIEDEIFTAKENIRVLKSEFENISLEYDYLSSSERLLEYQSLYFEDELIQKNINDIKIYNISKDINKFQNLKILPILGSEEKNKTCAFPTRLSLCTYPTSDKKRLSLEQSLLSPKKKK